MKKFIYLLLTLSFFACEKNEMTPTESVKLNSTNKTMLNNIHTENGHLVIKDLNTLDSILNILQTITPIERIAWENKVGFTSAYSHFKPYFDEFDRIESENELIDFQKKNQDILRITKTDNVWDINYPFQVEDLALVLSGNGEIKVGNSLWIYEADRKIFIHDATPERIREYKNATHASNLEGISIYYNNSPSTKGGQDSNSEILKEITEYGNKRKYSWALEVLRREVKEGNQVYKVRYLAFYQQAQKKKVWGGYKTYNTTYWVNLANFRIYNCPTDPYYGGYHTSNEDNGGRYFMIAYIKGDKFPSFDIYMGHGSRGYNPNDPLTYSYRNNFISYDAIVRPTCRY